LGIENILSALENAFLKPVFMLQDFSMPTIRKAIHSDREAVFRILRELDLEYPSLTPDHFWVADLDGVAVAVGRLEEFEKFCFLSALGTTGNRQGRGVAANLLEGMFKQCKKDIYLYTIIPNFFKKFGFEPTELCQGLPARKRFNCAECDPGHCVCMRRKPERDA